MDPIDGYNDLKQTSNFMHFTSLMDSARESISLVHNSLAWHSREPSVLEAEIIDFACEVRLKTCIETVCSLYQYKMSIGNLQQRIVRRYLNYCINGRQSDVPEFTSMNKLQNVIQTGLSKDENELEYYMTGIPSWIMQSFETRVFRQLDLAGKTQFIKSLLLTPNGKSALLSAIQYNTSILNLVADQKINLTVFAAERDLDVIEQLKTANNPGK